jgi:hypothetical protein
MIGETKCYLEAKRLQWRMAGPGLDATQGDFMDKLKEAGPGTYRIVALFEGQAYSLDISVVAHP